MTDPSETAASAPEAQEIKAGFVRLLSSRIHDISGDPAQMREIVYELARVKLLEQFTHADARESRELQQILERAIREVERAFAGNTASEQTPTGPANTASPPLPPSWLGSTSTPGPKAAWRPDALLRSRGRQKRSDAFPSLIRLAVILLLIAGAGAAVAFWPVMRTSFTASSPPPPAAPPASASQAAERTPDIAKEPPQPSMPLPTTFGVYALNEGQLQELKPVPGKIPDRRVAISAAINTPSATTLASGDVRFIVFKPDGGIDANTTEVRVVAKVSRAMGVDASGKASMVSAGDSWVIRSMSFPYKVGPVDDQPRMLLLQPEQDGFTLAPGRYVVVVKGVGYDFTVAGEVTDPNQCVERINAANGAFYSPCPPPR